MPPKFWDCICYHFLRCVLRSLRLYFKTFRKMSFQKRSMQNIHTKNKIFWSDLGHSEGIYKVGEKERERMKKKRKKREKEREKEKEREPEIKTGLALLPYPTSVVMSLVSPIITLPCVLTAALWAERTLKHISFWKGRIYWFFSLEAFKHLFPFITRGSCKETGATRRGARKASKRWYAGGVSADILNFQKVKLTLSPCTGPKKKTKRDKKQKKNTTDETDT